MKIVNNIISFVLNLLSDIGIFIINNPALSAIIFVLLVAIIGILFSKRK